MFSSNEKKPQPKFDECQAPKIKYCRVNCQIGCACVIKKTRYFEFRKNISLFRLVNRSNSFSMLLNFGWLIIFFFCIRWQFIYKIRFFDCNCCWLVKSNPWHFLLNRFHSILWYWLWYFQNRNWLYSFKCSISTRIDLSILFWMSALNIRGPIIKALRVYLCW